MGIPENIDALLVRFDITPETLAKVAGVSQSTISRWRTGQTSIRGANLERICSKFGLTRDDILSDENGMAAKEHGRMVSGAIVPKPSRPAYAPLLGRVHAGDAQEPEVLDERISLPSEVAERHPHAYFLQVEGDCMSNVYPEGCYILIDPYVEPRNGSIAVVSIDGADYVMRRYYRGATTLVLSPDSAEGDYDDIVIRDDDEHVVSLKGVVVWFQASKEME